MARSRSVEFGSVVSLAFFAFLAMAGVARADEWTVGLLAPEDGGSAGGREIGSTEPSVSSVQSFDELFTYPTEDGCSYSASIRGTIKPVVAGMGAGEKVEPDLAATAILSCPSSPTLKVHERIAGTGPITRGQLETLIERRASILRDDSGRRCSYVPDIKLLGEGLVGTGVTYLCPVAKP
jgi:hypothetical protein